MKKWVMPSPSPDQVSALAKSLELDPISAHLLAVRGVSLEEAKEFLTGSAPLGDPYLLNDMGKAVERVQAAVENGEKLCVYGDYDCDGITATVLLYTYLQNIGADVMYYIPDRDQEGYGMNMAAISAMGAKGVSLIVTVDNGITAIDEIVYAGRCGIDVIVTDHHQPRESLPACVAVIDPHRKDQENVFRDFAGVGVAFKLICALEQDDGGEMLEYYSDFVMLGTIADVVPLLGENRHIVRHGLKNLSHTQNVGLQCLLAECGFQDRPMDAASVAFVLAPRINAASRLGHVEKAMELLLCEEEESAQELASALCAYNKDRQQLEAAIIKDVASILQKNPQILHKRILILSGKGWHRGVIGIVCAQVSERFGKPCILLSEIDGELRGSGRSVGEFNLIECINRCAALLDQFGGHPAAAGVTLQKEKLVDFDLAMQQAASLQCQYMPVPTIRIDKSVLAGEMTLPVLKAICVLEPFGMKNESPVFALEKCRIDGIYVMGAGKHLRLKLTQQNETFYAVYFHMPPENFYYKIGESIDIAASMSINLYQNQEQISIQIKDVRLSGLDEKSYFTGREQYDRFYRDEPFAEDTAAQSVPDRSSIAALYRRIRDLNPYVGDYDGLYMHLLLEGLNYCLFRLGLDILEERGLVQISRDGKKGYRFSIAAVSQKTDLEQSPIMQKLKMMKG